MDVNHVFSESRGSKTEGKTKMVQIDLPKSYLTLVAVLGFGVVLAGSGFQGMVPNVIIAGLGVVIILVDMALWIIQKYVLSTKKQHVMEKNRT